jgi:phospholipid/cholesterol/gamma-HCH transport system permease protein
MSVKNSAEEIFAYVGRASLRNTAGVGKLGLFCVRAITTFTTSGVNLRRVFFQMNHIGVNSLGIVGLTGMTIGAVLAYHAYTGLSQFGTYQFVGPLVYLSMTREFGSILTGIMVTARAGSAMTAEIGTMRITEQIDALRTLSINTFRYLIVPRIIATTLIAPFLSLFCTVSGVAAGYVMSVVVLKINSELYTESVKQMLVMSDITGGLVKAAVFGFLCSLISTYKGYTTWGGSKGVGTSTIDSVVYSSVTIFVANYILTTLLFKS